MSLTQPETKLANRYRMQGVIGTGGAGKVYDAWDTQLERSVAIKTLHADADDSSVSSLWKEATRLAAVGHPNIVAIYDMGTDEGLPYIVMERLHGETLDKRVASGTMNLEEFASFAHQTLEALIAAHHVGMVHRDLKPSNLMLSKLPSGTLKVKVLDFGIAKFLSAPSEQTMNIEGTVTGSIHCIAPEQLNRDPVDHRSDLYALGCVCYFALAGVYPFTGPRFADIITAHLNHLVTDLKTRRTDLPSLVCDWVMALINRRPSHRYQSAAEALGALQNVLIQTKTGGIELLASVPSTMAPIAIKPPQQSRNKLAVAVAAVAVASAGVWAFSSGSQDNAGQVSTAAAQPAPKALPATPAPAPATPAPKIAVAPAPAPADPMQATPAADVVPPKPPAPAEVILRFAGSNTIGASLLPALMEAFLKKQGATKIDQIPGKSPEEMTVQALMPDEEKPIAIEISAHGSSTAFGALASGKCEIGMSSRQIKDTEAEKCARSGMGDMFSAACEHVVGLDGIAILTHKENNIAELTRSQIASIFSGRITDWSELGQPAAPIHLYARDAKSGTFDTFQSLVMGKDEIAASAERFEDSNALSDAIASDRNGIGFVGLPYVRQAKLLAVSEDGAAPFLATRFTVATEDYVLSRRLFLYTPANPQNSLVSRFVEFALSEAGQEIVNKVGFVKQTIDLQRPINPPGAPADYLTTIKGAERLSVNFRFRAGQSELDNKALRDIDRIAALAADPRFQQRELVLLGFADSHGASASNVKLSKDRARIVAQHLVSRGLHPDVVTGFGSALPVASNDSESGRDKNRRVEVWLK